MKKILFALMCTFAVLATGCQEKVSDTGIVLNETEVILNSSNEYQITAESPTPITYSSENEYHAVVDEHGLVTAMFVGETDIVLDNRSDTKRVKVIVEPKYNLFEEPITDFGITKEELISRLGEPDLETDETIGYLSSSSVAPMTMYAFQNGALNVCGVIVKSQYSGELGAFMAERYLLAGEDDGSFAFVNALDADKVTMGIMLQLYNLNYWIATYMPIDSTKSTSIPTGIHGIIQEFIK